MTTTRIYNVNLMTMDSSLPSGANGILCDSELWIHENDIVAVGPAADWQQRPHRSIDAKNQWCLPGFIDCHTHLIYAGSRADEFSQRLDGVPYATIAGAGGGILSSVRQTRAAEASDLLQQSMRRAQRLIDEGVTTLEVKSGYGLDQHTEVKMLNVARALARHLPVQVIRTYLGAHAVPAEYRGNAQAYIDFVCTRMIPLVAEQQLAQAVDVFCENVGFTLDQTRQVFAAAKNHGLPVKVHAEQLTNTHSAKLAAEYQALSADHLEYLSADDVPALADSGCVAVLLPGAFYYLKEQQLPPIAALRQYKVPMAVATDCNPGTSPVSSLLTCANMACVLFGLTPEEALAGITRHAASALGLTNKGMLKAGMAADCCLWNVDTPTALIYEINGYRPTARWIGGKYVG